jgi:hypothetical protein
MENEPEDRHVLAAAVFCSAQSIVTSNLAHFPEKALARHGIVAVSPDDYLLGFYQRHPFRVVRVLRQQGNDLNPPRSLDDTLSQLEIHVPQFVAAIRGDLAR